MLPMADAGHAEAETRNTVELFGVAVDAITMEQTADAVRSMFASGRPHQHVVLNAAKVVEMERDPELRRVVQSCDLVNADGMAVVWASRILGVPLPERVAGIDLFERLVQLAQEDGRSVFFLGATDDVVAGAAEIFTQRYPGLRVAGYRNGYWKDDAEVIAEVRAAAPDLLFLAIPSPRKEFWLSAHLEELNVPFVMGVGGSFDVVAGKVSRAPRWMQRVGLEWSWRLIQEPRKMWRRYLFTNTSFIRITAQAWWESRR